MTWQILVDRCVPRSGAAVVAGYAGHSTAGAMSFSIVRGLCPDGGAGGPTHGEVTSLLRTAVSAARLPMVPESACWALRGDGVIGSLTELSGRMRFPSGSSDRTPTKPEPAPSVVDDGSGTGSASAGDGDMRPALGWVEGHAAVSDDPGVRGQHPFALREGSVVTVTATSDAGSASEGQEHQPPSLRVTCSVRHAGDADPSDAVPAWELGPLDGVGGSHDWAWSGSPSRSRMDGVRPGRHAETDQDTEVDRTNVRAAAVPDGGAAGGPACLCLLVSLDTAMLDDVELTLLPVLPIDVPGMVGTWARDEGAPRVPASGAW